MSRMFYTDAERAEQDRALLYSRIKELEEWIEPFAYCPCCEKTSDKCSPGCTFAADCPDSAEVMASARYILYRVEAK